MAYAIIRHQKIRGYRHLVSAGLHNTRGAETPNADKDATPPIVLVGSDKPHKDVMAKLRTHGLTGPGGHKLKKDAVLAVEVMCAASPEWWQERGWVPGRPVHEQNPAVREALHQWVSATRDHLTKRFGIQLASMVVHLDEKTPHVQALAVPLYFGADKREKEPKERWRIRADEILGGRQKMKEHVTAYASAMKHLGLSRGEDRDAVLPEKDRRTYKDWHADNERTLAEQKSLKAEIARKAAEEAAAMTQKAAYDAAGITLQAKDKAARMEREIQAQQSQSDEMLAKTAEEAAAVKRKALEEGAEIARQAQARAAEIAGQAHARAAEIEREARARSVQSEIEAKERASKIEAAAQEKLTEAGNRLQEASLAKQAVEALQRQLNAALGDLRGLLEPIRAIWKQYEDSSALQKQVLAHGPAKAVIDARENPAIRKAEEVLAKNLAPPASQPPEGPRSAAKGPSALPHQGFGKGPGQER